jgi:hypothetical protein
MRSGSRTWTGPHGRGAAVHARALVEQGRDFMRDAPISPGDKEKIAHGNVERLLGLA